MWMDNVKAMNEIPVLDSENEGWNTVFTLENTKDSIFLSSRHLGMFDHILTAFTNAVKLNGWLRVREIVQKFQYTIMIKANKL